MLIELHEKVSRKSIQINPFWIVSIAEEDYGTEGVRIVTMFNEQVFRVSDSHKDIIIKIAALKQGDPIK